MSNNKSNSHYELSNTQVSAVINTGNKELINIMNKGNEYAKEGNVQKEATYHSYVQDTLDKNYGLKFVDSSSQKASAYNSTYTTSSSSSSTTTNYYGFYYSN